MTFRTWSLLWLAVLVSAAVVVFWPGLRSGYFADDLSYFFYPPPSNLFHYFTHENPSQVMYRPIFSTFMVGVQRLWGIETLPIHLVSLLCHAMLCWLVALSTVSLGYSRLQGMIGSGFFLVAQINTYSILGNDTLSQVAGVFFGCLAAWFLYFPGRVPAGSGRPAAMRPTLPGYLLALLCLAISLGLKETGTAYLGVVGVALLAANNERYDRRRAFMRTAVQLLPFVIMVIAYMMIRAQYVLAPPQFGEGRYAMNIGMNIPKNIALFLAASTTALSSLTTFVATAQRNLPLLALAGLTAVLFVGLVLRGLWFHRRDRIVWILLLLYFFGFLPAILFNHVSEVYIYNSFPFLSALVGIGLGELWSRSKGTTSRIALGVAMGSLLLVHAGSVRSKGVMLQANGERAYELIEELRPFVESAPPDGTVFLLNPPNETVEYSAYVMNDFNILMVGFPTVQNLLGREDLHMDIRSQADIAAGLRENDSTVIVTMRDGRVVRVGDSVVGR